jgi:FkbM family methyltransferase
MNTSVTKQLKNNEVIKKIFKSKLINILRNTLIVRAIEQSVGDWRYPLIVFSWWIAKILVPRRKVKINGLSFTLSCTNWITHFRWYLFKSKEPETIEFIDNNLMAGDVFFDIGANVGVFTIYASKRHENIMVYSFEPEASNLAILKENIIENSITNKVITYGVGVGDSNGLSMLHLQDMTPGSALHSENKRTIEFSVEGNRPIVWAEGIYSVSLDSFCTETNVVPNVIKIDTDGNEKKILMGAKSLLKNPLLRAILIEMPYAEFENCSLLLLESGFIKEVHHFKNTRNEIWTRQ